MKYTFEQLKEILSADTLNSADPSALLNHVSIDSRKISFPSSSLFIAIKTDQRNGHTFIKDAYAKGVRNFLVSEKADLEDANVLLVNDTVSSLQKLAAHHRKQFNIPVVGITGSNGKTIVKEWLNYLLQTQFNIVRSPRSYNSQIGVPLSVLEIKSENTLALFEAGISKQNEMAALQRIIQPTIGVLTHIGDAHDDGFSSREEKITEKLKLFAATPQVIFNSDDENISAVIDNISGKKISFGKDNDAAIQIKSIQIQHNQSLIQLKYKNDTFEFIIPYTTSSAIENAVCCFAVCCAVNANLQKAIDRMPSLPQAEMRLQLQKALGDSILINDSYSFDLSSFSAALDFLQQQKQNYKTTIILSELPEGKANEYDHVLSMLAERNIDRYILIGTQWLSHIHAITNKRVEFFETTDSFIHQFSASHFAHEIILIKGARECKFDELAALFLSQVHQTVMRVDLSAMIHNLKAFRSLLHPKTKMMAMVKAFGYGSGSGEPAKVLEYQGINYLAVAYADEGVQLRREGISVPIMVLNVDDAAFHSLIEYDLEPEIFSFRLLSSFKNFLAQQGIENYPVHIKLDSGMHRLGFEEKDIEQLCMMLQETKSFVVRSVFTHLAASEDPGSDEFTQQQYERFQTMVSQIRSCIAYEFITHISNSAAILRHKDIESDMVRLGIGLYGVKPSGVDIDLRTVTFLTTTIAQIRMVKKGDAVGYNRKGVVNRDSIIATLRIGYADGFSRSLGNGKGRVFIKGKFAPVIGNVCMDMIMVDVTDVADVQENDEVEILGDHITAEEMAETCGTIPYEILTGISGRVKRVYLME